MFVSPGIIVAVMAAQQAAYRQEEEERKEREKKKKKEKKKKTQCAISLLLKNQKGKSMVVEKKEKIEMYRIIDTKDCGEEKWVAKDKDNNVICKRKTFSLCFEEFLSKNKPKGVEIIPFSIDERYSIVDAYLIMVKVDDEEAIRKEKEIMEVATKVALGMSKDIETAW